jgi:tetratricopeptide (TPR) repeat protein
MIKRTAPDGRGSDVSTRLNLTDVAAEYISKFAPPDPAMLSKVQVALKKLRDVAELSAVQTAAYKYDMFAIRSSTKDERIVSVYLNQALRNMKERKLEAARADIDRAMSLLPSFPEVYRVAALIASVSGDFYRASDELDIALEYVPDSPIVNYQYAQMLLQKMEDPESALARIQAALGADPGADTLLTLKALCLVRLGRFPEAAAIYSDQLSRLEDRPRKWRITTRDQSAECYRRWAEQDLKMREDEQFRRHLEMGLSILEDAIAKNDFDDRMGNLYISIVEDALFNAKAHSDTDYASVVLNRLGDARCAANIPSIQRFSIDSLRQAFSSDPRLLNLIDRLAGSTESPCAGEVVTLHADRGPELSAFVKSLLVDKSFGFLVNGKSEWFFHRSGLAAPDEWANLREGQAVKFHEEIDAVGRRRAVNIRVHSSE